MLSQEWIDLQREVRELMQMIAVLERREQERDARRPAWERDADGWKDTTE